MSGKPKVAFVCTHNSCRSQIAEALSKLLAADTFEAFSAGTEIKKAINPDAVNIIKKRCGVDMTQSQRPKPLSEIPPVDIVVTMGCGVQCPYLPCRHREDWGLEDPTGMPDTVFEQTARAIERNVLDLKRRVAENRI